MNQNAVIQDPSIQDPSIQDPSIQDPSIQDPSIQDPSIQDPSIQDPSIQDTGSQRSGPAAPPAAPPISEGREQMNAVDTQIIELMLHRIEISRRIQAARLAEGGRRIDLRRETEIIGRYTAALGRSGTAVGMAMLELGRGRADRPGGGEPAARA